MSENTPKTAREVLDLIDKAVVRKPDLVRFMKSYLDTEYRGLSESSVLELWTIFQGAMAFFEGEANKQEAESGSEQSTSITPEVSFCMGVFAMILHGYEPQSEQE